jgi:hypothetical protein
MFNIFFSENHFVYDIKLKKYVQTDTELMIIQYNTVQALWVLNNKAIDTHRGYVQIISAPGQH